MIKNIYVFNSYYICSYRNINFIQNNRKTTIILVRTNIKYNINKKLNNLPAKILARVTNNCSR